VGVEENMSDQWLTAVMEEYKALNAEILQRNTQLFSVVIACVAGGITIIGLIYKAEMGCAPAMLVGASLIILLGIAFFVILKDTILAWSRLCEIEEYVNSKIEPSKSRFPLSWQREHGIVKRPPLSWLPLNYPKPNTSEILSSQDSSKS
jgi:hypothetical protein